MSSAAYELARLTTKSKQIDGMGFGGSAPDNLEVAGALGFRNPVTKRKLSKQAEALARYKYCFDDSCQKTLIDALANCKEAKRYKFKDCTVANLCRVAVINYKHTLLKFNKVTMSQEFFYLNNSQLAVLIEIKPQSFTDNHRALYDAFYKLLCELDSDVSRHLSDALKEGE